MIYFAEACFTLLVRVQEYTLYQTSTFKFMHFEYVTFHLREFYYRQFDLSENEYALFFDNLIFFVNPIVSIVGFLRIANP